MGSMRALRQVPPQMDELLPDQLDTLLDSGDFPLTADTTCGYWIFRGKLCQSLASKKSYIALYGLIGLLFNAMFAYYNGTISTIEKLFKIPSRNSGIIMVGNDVGSLLLSSFLGYYCARGHRPRWISFGVLTFVVFCLMNAAPHFMYGVGTDTLRLTLQTNENGTSVAVGADDEELCHRDGIGYAQCDQESGSLAPQVIFFVAQLISGIGQTLYNSLGMTYLDDNVQKNKLPSLFSIGVFMRLIGTAIGYTLAAQLLQVYVVPELTPTITPDDPRWLGAWWIGWLVLSVPLMLAAFLASLFPKSLPRAAVRRAVQQERDRRKTLAQEKQTPADELQKQSMADMMATFKRLVANRVYILTTLSFLFYSFGYSPYWMFGAKYMEIQYRLTASQSSMVLGSFGLIFSALGVLVAGLVITQYRPSARRIAMWNTCVGVISVCGMLGYAFLGCDDVSPVHGLETTSVVANASCSIDCHCDYVSNAPVCGDDGITYLSACHAGCTSEGSSVFGNCSCVESSSKTAVEGSCPTKCVRNTVIFIAIMSLLKFIGSTARTTNFLISIRCVPEMDKAASMGLSTFILSVFSFVPSPIFYGYIMDQSCLVWGRTCLGSGYCWLYDRDSLRWILNSITASLIAMSVLFDFGIWWTVGNLVMFDADEDAESDESKANEMVLKKGPKLLGRRTSEVVLMERRASLNL